MVVPTNLYSIWRRNQRGFQALIIPTIRVFVIVASIAGASLLGFPRLPGSATPSVAQQQLPYLEERPFVVLASRPVCSMMGSSKVGAGIIGQDGGNTVAIGGVVYWNFGDTLRITGGQIPNSIGWSADTDASDCITLTPKEANGAAVPLLAVDWPRELTVWPLGMAATATDTVHFFYASVVPDSPVPWKVAGIGIASFDTGTLSGERALGGDLVWRKGVPLPNRIYVDGEYVYVFSNMSRQLWTTDTILSRVPTARFDSPADYEYWEPGSPDEPGRWLTGLWDPQAGYWDPALANVGALWRQPGMHNGVEVAYNHFLGKWVAVYATNFTTSINVRVSDALTGPWDEADSVMVDCRFFHPPNTAGRVVPFPCYTGVQHEVYSRDGDRTMYISYASGETYQVYLHEIRLAVAVTEWIDDQGRTIYLAGSAPAPGGFEPAGVSFYASDIPVPGFQEIRRWQHVETGESRYSASQPEPNGDYRDLGVAFFAPADAGVAEDTNARYSPVFRWTRDGSERYSPMDLDPLGYQQQEIAFFAACPESIGGAAADCPDAFVGPGSFDTSKDSDGDGCTDVAELGSNPFIGGLRDPNNYWDFYDVPATDGARDGDIALLTDVLAVVFRLGTNDGNGTAPVNRYSDPQARPEDMVSYHPAFDRSPPPPGQNQYALGPPDGHIGLWDLLGVISQYGHRC